MTNISKHKTTAMDALQKAVERRRVWMDALMGKIGKEELESKGIRFINIAE